MNTGETQVKRVTSLSSSSPYRGSIKGEERCQFLWLCPVPLSYLPLHSWQPQTSLTLVAGWIQLAAPTTAALLDPGKETESSRHTLYMKAPAKHNIQLCCCRSEAGRMPWRRLLSSSDNQCNWAGISLSTERLRTMSNACPVLPSGVRVTREHRETATSFYAPVPGIAPEIKSVN